MTAQEAPKEGKEAVGQVEWNFSPEGIPNEAARIIWEEVLDNRIANYQAFAQLSEEELSQPSSQISDSPKKELAHLVRNTVMRGNVLSGKNPFDFSGFPQVAKLEEALNLSKSQLLDLYQQTTSLLYEPLTQEGVDPYKEVQWFGKPIKLLKLIVKASTHEAKHLGLNVRDGELHGGKSRVPQDIAIYG